MFSISVDSKGWALLVVLGVGLTGCGTIDQAAPVAGATMRADLTADSAGSSRPQPVVGSIRSEALLKEAIPLVADLARAKSLTGIVQGTVVGVEWGASDDGLNAKTTYRVTVGRDLKGTYGGTISVTEDGGYLAADAVRLSIDDKFGTRSPAQNGYIEERFEGASHPSVGDEVLLFVRPSFGDPEKLALVSSVYGRFTKNKDGRYIRAAQAPGWDSGADVNAVEAAVAGSSR